MNVKPLDSISFIPKNSHPGSFGAIRKHDIHTGIDLYCENHATVYSMTHGIVIDIQPFTGKNADSPWWNDTDCIIVKTEDGKYIVYGELKSKVKVNNIVFPGMILGKVKQVLKKDKGVTPTSMLHIEYYDETFDLNPVIWHLDQEKPKSLLDPIVLLNFEDEDPKYITLEIPDAITYNPDYNPHYKSSPTISHRWFVKDGAVHVIELLEKQNPNYEFVQFMTSPGHGWHKEFAIMKRK